MYIGIELPTEEKAFKLKKERAIKINDSMNYIAERSWLLLKYSEPAISKESFENEVFMIIFIFKKLIKAKLIVIDFR